MVHEGLKKVLNGIVAAAQAAGRAPGDVTLIAVSKTFDGPDEAPEFPRLDISAQHLAAVRDGMDAVSNSRSGTAFSSRIVAEGLNMAGKTGTSNDSRDSWFAGYTGDHLAELF